MWLRIKAFFSDAVTALWIQNLIVVLSVIVAFFALRDTDSNLRRANSVTLAQRYFLEKPALSVQATELRRAQYNVVQDAKKAIPNYNQEANRAAGWSQLFEKARPMVLENIRNSPDLTNKYHEVVNFFMSAIACVQAEVCERDTAVRLLSAEMLAFYNAVCPYMEGQEVAFDHEDESPQFLNFLVIVAGERNSNNYFCRDKLGSYLTRR